MAYVKQAAEGINFHGLCCFVADIYFESQMRFYVSWK